MTMKSTANNKEKENTNDKPVRILALHGKGGSSSDLEQKLSPLSNQLRDKIQIDYLNAPHENGQWWLLPPGKRSFTADTYTGFDMSESLINKVASDYDVLLGHSQGAILLISLLSLNKINPKRIILNGVAWPNPFTKQLEELQIDGDEMKILFVTGRRDAINPPDTQQRVKESLMNVDGIDVSTIFHDNGHGIPMNDDGARDAIIDWITSNCFKV